VIEIPRSLGSHITASAENIREEVQRRGFKHVDAVASSLALTLMSDQLKNDILSESGGVLHRSGVFTQYLYLHGIQWQGGRPSLFGGARMLRRHFRDVDQTLAEALGLQLPGVDPASNRYRRQMKGHQACPRSSPRSGCDTRPHRWSPSCTDRARSRPTR